MNTTALGFLVSDPSSKPMLASHSLDQLLWFVRNATLVVFRSLTTLNPTALEYALTAPRLVQSLTFYTITLLFVVFYMLSLFLKKKSTKRRALISFYSANVALLCAIFWFTSSNDLGGVRAGASLLSSGAFFFPLLSLLMVLGF